MTWKVLLDPYTRRYAKGFDPSKMYQFRRVGGEVQSFRLCDVGDYFNIAGLYWRDPFNGTELERSLKNETRK